MEIQYRYKDKITDDIRNIVYNNNLHIDIEYLTQEYIPYQVFITGRTAFKNVTLEFTPPYDPLSNEKTKDFHKSIDDYLERREYKGKNIIAAVSGGVDSSLMALTIKPDTIYSGYYDDSECDETTYSGEVAKVIKANHLKYELKENEFIRNLNSFIGDVCTPIAGYGGVMEYVTLKRALKDCSNTEYVLFGNGGDEVFFGYPFNYFVKEIDDYGDVMPKYMSNFAPQKRYIVDKSTNMLIASSLNRSSYFEMHDSYATKHLLRKLDTMNDVKHKLLYTNINIILPSLLHLNNQMCKANNIIGLNPLTNRDLVKWSNDLNNPITDIPKNYLRTVDENMPESIVTNNIKRGFPMPLAKWFTAKTVVKSYYDRFFDRCLMEKKREFTKLDRYAWGVLQAELFLEFFHYSPSRVLQ